MGKVISKNFEDFKGNDRGASDITRSPGYSANTKNVEFLDNLSVMKRKGSKLFACHDGLQEIRGVFPHYYLDANTGETKNELIAIKSDSAVVYRLRRGVFGVRSTRTNATMSLLLHSNNEWRVDILNNGASESGFPKDYGTGLEGLGVQDEIADLLTDVFATGAWEAQAISPNGNNIPIALLPISTSFSVKLGAIINGNQSDVSTITVDSGHDLVAGDKIYYPYESVDDAFVRTVASVTATTITISGDPVTVDDNLFLFPAGFEYYAFESLNGKALSPNFPPTSAHFKNPTGVNQNNCLYFNVNDDFIFKYDGNSYYRAGVPTQRGLRKADYGFFPDFTGVATVVTGYHNTAIVDDSASGNLSGVYNYYTTYIHKDNRGNVTESKLIPYESTVTVTNKQVQLGITSAQASVLVGTTANSTQAAVTTIDMTEIYPELQVGDSVQIRDDTAGVDTWVTRTITDFSASGNTITVSSAVSVTPYNPVYLLRREDAVYNTNSAVINGTQNSVTAITVYSGHTMKAGDIAYLYDYVKEQYVEILVTSTGATTVTLASSVSVTAKSVMSAGLKIGIYRTRDSGLDAYLVAEIPNNGVHAQTFYTDNTADDALGAKYLAPIRDPYPNSKARIVAAHQGIQVFAGGKDNPNTVFFSEPTDIEAYPIATNSFDIPFTISGDITGLVSENDLLTIFKEFGRAVVRGELYSGNFSVEVIEDGIGASCQSAIAKTPVGTILLSSKGFYRMVNGQLDLSFASRLSDDFIGADYSQIDGVEISSANEQKLVTKRATAVNDFINERYICFVPAEEGVTLETTGSPGTAKSVNTTYSKIYVYDYKQEAWIDYDMGEPLVHGYGGLCMHEKSLVYCNGKYLFKEHGRGDLYDYADNTQPISMLLESGWESAGEPSIFKKFLRVKTWSLQPEYHIPNDLVLKTYRDFNSVTPHTTATMDFSSSSTQSRLIKLRSGQKMRAIMLEFSNNILHESPLITGYELEIAPVFDKEIKE